MIKILFLAGSARKNSYNKILAKNAYNAALTHKDIKATLIDLKDFSMPIYDGDTEDESGLPENAKKLKEIFIKHDGFFIASPEYNSSIPPLLKNALDWISRKENNKEEALIAFNNKVAALASASPGGFGGIRALVPLRMMLSNINVHLIPNQLCIASAHEAFDDNGNFKNSHYSKNLENLINVFISTTKSLAK